MAKHESYEDYEKEAITYLLKSSESVDDPERYFTLIISELLGRFGKICPLEIETLLRKFESCRFLLAVSPTLESLDQHRIVLPQTGEQEYPFYMFFMQIGGIGSIKSINNILKQNFGIDYEENQIRLAKSGLLVLRQNSFSVKGITLGLN